jgi:hypothetical protein
MSSITRIQNNQITDSTITYAKIATGTLTGALFSPTLTLSSNVTITGNLSVIGNTTTINATNTYINDPLVVFNNGYSGSLAGYDIGIIVNRNLASLGGYGGVNTAWIWVENDQAFEAIATTSTGGNVQSIPSSGFSNIKIGNLTSIGATVTGTMLASTVNAATIGNTNAAISGATATLTGLVTAGTVNAATIGNTNAAISGASGTFTGVVTSNALNAATIGNTSAAHVGATATLTGLITAGTVNAATIGNASAVFTGATLSTTGNISGGGAIFSNVGTNSLVLYGNTISSNTGKVNFGSISSVVITGGSATQYLQTDGNGNLSFATINTQGNTITLGSNTSGQLVSNAVTLTTSTYVTDAVAQLNAILGKLVPASPPNFPATALTQSTGTVTGFMTTGFTQADNTGTGTAAVSAGTSVNVIRTAVFATGTISNSGTNATSGNIILYLNGNVSPSSYHQFAATPSSSDNGTYGNLVISSTQDYHNVVSTVNAGFWYVFSAAVNFTSSILPGWNRANLYYSGDAASTSTLTWYYDSSSPSVPAFSATSMVFSSNTVTYYPSTIPHLNSSAGFTVRGSVQNLSGDIYASTSGTGLFSTSTAATPFTAPVNVSYESAGVGRPLTRNNTAVATFSTTSNISGTFGAAVAATGPTVAVSNGYSATTSPAFASGNIVLFKTTSTGSTTVIDETNIIFNTALSGSTTPAAFRVNNPDAGTGTDNPAFTSPGTTFNTLYVTDVTNVGQIVTGGTTPGLRWDNNNYSTGYLPVGPNLSGRSGSNPQYFTFKFVRTSTSQFSITFTPAGSTTGIAGMWIAMPGYGSISGYNSGNVNGWLTMTLDSTQSGGGSTKGVLTVNGTNTQTTLDASFGTASSTNATNNEIWVRIKLSPGQALSALYLGAAV